MNPLGIMQGRLSQRPGAAVQAFPWMTWREEFALARDCGFSRIEWLLTADRLEDNPLWTDDGVREIRRQITATGVSVASVCADCFIRQPLVRVSGDEQQANMATLERLVVRCAQIGIEVVLIPVLEGAAISDRRHGLELLHALQGALSIAEASGIQLGIECDLPGATLRELIDYSGMPALGAYYDVGNAVANGQDVMADVSALAPVLCGIHVKDRTRDGVSLPLGDGDVDFAAFFTALTSVGYAGTLILETPAGPDPLASARQNRAFVEGQ